MTVTDMRMEAPKAVTIMVLVLVSVAGGCTPSSRPESAAHGSSTTGGPTRPLVAPTSSPATTLAAGRTSSTSQPGQVSSVPTCPGSVIAISSSPVEAALGNVAVILLFRNAGLTTCRLYGYPGVAGLDQSGRQVVQARRTLSGYFAILPTPYRAVALPPNATASAIVEGGDNPVNGSTCSTYPAFLVTPPDAYTSTKVPISSPHFTVNGFPGCVGLLVQPVVAGATGGQP